MAISQYIPINAGATTLTVAGTAVASGAPAGARYGEGYVRTAAVVFYRDGTTPTATAGEQADVGDRIILRSDDEVTKALFIRQSGVSASIDWTWFRAGAY